MLNEGKQLTIFLATAVNHLPLPLSCISWVSTDGADLTVRVPLSSTEVTAAEGKK